jgi:hypothetical protein
MQPMGIAQIQEKAVDQGYARVADANSPIGLKLKRPR